MLIDALCDLPERESSRTGRTTPGGVKISLYG